MKNLIITAFMLTSVSAYPMAAWTPSNDPLIKMDLEYKTKLSDLPERGKLTKRPWSGDYWATFKGGISHRWLLPTDNRVEKVGYELQNMNSLTDSQIITMSPAEKYDLFLGDEEYSLTTFERERTQVLKTLRGTRHYDPSVEIKEWEGLCHAWAPATLAFDNPRPIFVEGAKGHMIPFGSADIKALLTYHVDINSKGDKTKFLGSRCYLDFKPFLDKYESGAMTFDELNRNIDRLRVENAARYDQEACMDTNAGAFHVVLTNQIGLKDEGFIIDRTRDLEVWNQPVYSYSTKIVGDKEGASASAAPGTVKEVTIEAIVVYVGEVAPRWHNKMSERALKRIVYKYVLEINKTGEIIGGEWLSYNRPDFIYKEEAPKFTGYFKELEELYKRATAPKNPKVLASALAKLKKHIKAETNKKDFVRKLVLEKTRKKILKAAKKAGKDRSNALKFIDSAKDLVAIQKEKNRNLFEAVKRKRIKDIKKYIHMGASVNASEGTAQPEELMNRIIHKKTKELIKLFIDNGATLETVLIRAVSVGDLEIFNTLIKAGANTNYYSEEKKTSPLLKAAHRGELKMLKILLENGAAKTINAKGIKGRTALMLAIRGLKDGTDRTRMKIIELLIKNGIDVKAQDERKKDAIYHAGKKGNMYKNRIIRLIKKA